jgi:hypothetical protein
MSLTSKLALGGRTSYLRSQVEPCEINANERDKRNQELLGLNAYHPSELLRKIKEYFIAQEPCFSYP